MATDLGELLVPYMPTVRVPRTGDRVFKSECAFSFDSPVSVYMSPPPHTHERVAVGGVAGWDVRRERATRESAVCVCPRGRIPRELERK